jgi:WD40 repeat protein
LNNRAKGEKGLPPNGRGQLPSHLCIIAIDDIDAQSKIRDSIDEQVRRVREWVEGSEGNFKVTQFRIRGRSATQQLNRAIAKIRALPPQAGVILYVTGHGHRSPQSRRHRLLLPDGELFETEVIIQAAARVRAKGLLVLLDSCYSGTATASIYEVLEDQRQRGEAMPPQLCVVVSGQPEERIQVLAFTDVLTEALRILQKPQYAATENASSLSIAQFAYAVGEAAAGSPFKPQLAWPNALAADHAPCVALPRPGRWRSMVLGGGLGGAHTARRTRGEKWVLGRGAYLGDSPDDFQGRRAETKAIREFLCAPLGEPNVLVVAGPIASGKTALLQWALHLMGAQGAAVADPGNESRIWGLNASGLKPAEVLQNVSAAVDEFLQASEAVGRNASTNTTPRASHPLANRANLVPAVIVDSVDESTDPPALLGALLALVTRSPGSVRLVAALRTPSQGDEELLDSITQDAPSLTVKTVMTDSPDTLNDLRAFVSRHLTETRESPYYADQLAALPVANAIVQRTGPHFIDAQYACRLIIGEGKRVDIQNDSWLDRVGRAVVESLKGDVAAFADRIARPQHEVLSVLRAAALAQGKGTPWTMVWRELAFAIGGGEVDLYDEIIGKMLQSPLAGYLMTDSENNDRVYRPRHERIREVLEREPLLLLTRQRTLRARRVAEPVATVHARIAAELASAADEAPQWYARKYAVVHAAKGNSLTDETIPRSFLKWEASGQVRSLLGLPIQSTEYTRNLSSWGLLEGSLCGSDPSERLASVDFHSLRGPGEGSRQGGWQDWSIARDEFVASPSGEFDLEVIHDHGSALSRSLLALSGNDGVVRLFDAATGERYGRDVLVFDDERAVVLGSLQENWAGLVLLTREQIRVFNLLTLEETRVEMIPAGAGGPSRLIPTPNGATLVVGGRDGFIRTWALAREGGMRISSVRHDSRIVAVTVESALNDNHLLATSDAGGVRFVWEYDSASEELVQRRVFHKSRDRRVYWRLALGRQLDGSPVLVSDYGGIGAVDVVNPETGVKYRSPLVGRVDPMYFGDEIGRPGELFFAVRDAIWSWDVSTDVLREYRRHVGQPRPRKLRMALGAGGQPYGIAINVEGKPVTWPAPRDSERTAGEFHSRYGYVSLRSGAQMIFESATRRFRARADADDSSPPLRSDLDSLALVSMEDGSLVARVSQRREGLGGYAVRLHELDSGREIQPVDDSAPLGWEFFSMQVHGIPDEGRYETMGGARTGRVVELDSGQHCLLARPESLALVGLEGQPGVEYKVDGPVWSVDALGTSLDRLSVAAVVGGRLRYWRGSEVQSFGRLGGGAAQGWVRSVALGEMDGRELLFVGSTTRLEVYGLPDFERISVIHTLALVRELAFVHGTGGAPPRLVMMGRRGLAVVPLNVLVDNT